jgi:hypothetical protein
VKTALRGWLVLAALLVAGVGGARADVPVPALKAQI